MSFFLLTQGIYVRFQFGMLLPTCLCFFTLRRVFFHFLSKTGGTVDGRNPTPPDMYETL